MSGKFLNWKPLLALPLAAFLAGERVAPPQLKPSLPYRVAGCPQFSRASQIFLLAHAYRAEDKEKSEALRAQASSIIASCKISDELTRRFK